jgi:DNA helicase HerA-like ATPase
MAKPIGVILSKSTTAKALCQLYEDFENTVFEGELCFIQYHNRNMKVLSRIDRIAPFSEFFEEGDVWSEARRKEAPIPSDLSRRYVTIELELLGEAKSGYLGEVTVPPSPGDRVYKIESEDEILKIISPDSKDTYFINFGKLFGYTHVPLSLDINAIPMHLSVLGVTGSGKSYTTGYLIELLSDIKVGNHKTALPIMIIDANGDYLDFYESFHIEGKNVGNFSDVYRFVFNNSPAKLNKGTRILSMDPNVFEPREVAELIVTYYSGGILNELQVAGLELAFRRLQEEGGYEISSLLLRSYDRLIAELEDARREKLIHDQTFGAIRRALDKFKSDVVDSYALFDYSNLATLNSNFIDEITNPKKPTLSIIDFSADGAPGVSPQLKQLVVSYITKILLKKFTEYKINGVDRILLLIIEESQNYCPNLVTYPIGYSLARNNLAQIATQGRKFGLSLCLVSQRPSFVDPIVLSMVNTFIIHRISAEDIAFIRKISGGLPKVIENKLVNLTTGRAIVSGQMNKLGFPVVVDIPERKILPKMGKIDVSAILRR